MYIIIAGRKLFPRTFVVVLYKKDKYMSLMTLYYVVENGAHYVGRICYSSETKSQVDRGILRVLPFIQVSVDG